MCEKGWEKVILKKGLFLANQMKKILAREKVPDYLKHSVFYNREKSFSPTSPHLQTRTSFPFLRCNYPHSQRTSYNYLELHLSYSTLLEFSFTISGNYYRKHPLLSPACPLKVVEDSFKETRKLCAHCFFLTPIVYNIKEILSKLLKGRSLSNKQHYFLIHGGIGLENTFFTPKNSDYGINKCESSCM